MLPNITISTVDLGRIDQLLETLPPAHASGPHTLEEELLRANVVDPRDMPPKVVTMNSRVRFRLEGAGELCKTLVYPKDLARAGDALSVLSPVGSALLGLSEGDRIEWLHPDGKPIVVQVLEVVYQPERAGDFHL